MQQIPDIKLISGRIIRHYLQPNGSQNAIPVTGNYWMTHDEGLEYERIREDECKQDGSTWIGSMRKEEDNHGRE